jgi:hypothetical protein
MSKIDKQKEWIGVWKIALFFLLGSEFTLIGFIFNNFDKLNEIKLIFSTFALLILLIGIIITAIYLKKEIDKLEEIND